MSTRQYIGARYVPKFFDWDGSPEWRSGVAYEALTIVTRNGNSYTSKIPVPSNIGAPESNPEYWVATGLYNEQIESIREAIIGLQTGLSGETSARESADTALSGRLDDEESARESADTALSDRLDDEESARETGDTTLSDRLDDEKSARESADTALSDRILAEIAAREAGDTAIMNILNTVIGVGESNILVVSKHNSRFSTINDAITYARTYCTLNNRVTIVIIGGGTTIYNESIDLDDNPGIDFFGIGLPIVRSAVAWRYSTLRCSNAITCYGIHFENYYTPAGSEHAGYALHADPVTGLQRFIRCRFYSDNNAGAGIGTGNNGQINFYDCDFVSPVESLYLHNNATNGTAGQWARFYNCNFETPATSVAAIRVYDAAAAANPSYSSQMGLVFAKCIAYPNTKVRFVYDGTNSAWHVPSQGRSITTVGNGNIFLVKSSVGSNILGLDFYKNKFQIQARFKCVGASQFVACEDAIRYNVTVKTLKYSSDDGVNWTDSTASSIGVVVGEPDVNLIRLQAGIMTAGRCIEAVMDCSYSS